MSIRDDNDEEIVHLPGFWTLAAKGAIAISVPATLMVISLLAWVVNKSFEHDARLAVLEFRANYSKVGGLTPPMKPSAGLLAGDNPQKP